MKAEQLEAILKQRHPSKQKKAFEQLVKEHIIGALAYFYEGAQVGDNPLELRKHIPYAEEGEDVYVITGIEMMFNDNPKGEMYFHQAVESDPSEASSNPLSILPLDDLIKLLKAFEKQMKCYFEDTIELPKK